MYIETQGELEAFVQRAGQSSILAIDTEFLREKTYYATLCLIQVATDGEVSIIDPLRVDDLTALAPLLGDPSITKVFHAGYQDIELLYRCVGTMPAPVFDTQVAATLLGHTQQVGYASLVGSLCGVRLKKADSFTDWSRRPLTESQLHYASEDVVYLPKMYELMTRRLREKNRLDWLSPEFEALVDPARFEVDPAERYLKLRHVGSLGAPQLVVAREMAAWREREAQRRNVPRKWVLTDEQVVEACKRELGRIDDLFMVRGVRERISVPQARDLLAQVKKALASPRDTWPTLERPMRGEPNVDVQLDLMMALVRMRAREHEIAVPTLAGHDELVAVARGYREGIGVLSGWRGQLIGDELVELAEGRLSLRIAGRSVVVEPVAGDLPAPARPGR
ncbi:ribonuclease D [Eggerthellaceae bacterium zg-997]|nr:ribonuclease D [Eggerthellaceae bacterium zg-997]